MRTPFLCALLVLSTATLVFGQDTNFANGPQYLLTGSPLFARSIATPTLSLEGPPLEAGASNATAGMTAGTDNQTVTPQPAAQPDLFSIYYGPPAPSIIEISFAEASAEMAAAELPASLLDAGVSLTTTAEMSGEPGYGITLGGVASHERAHARRATRVYTNADLEPRHVEQGKLSKPDLDLYTPTREQSQ